MDQPLREKAFEMAERLGMTVGDLGERMTAAELLEWIAYDSIHTSEEWVRSALLRLTISQLAGDRGTTLERFLPPRRKPEAKPVDAWAKCLATFRSIDSRTRSRTNS
jgi:hypothetical protein